MVNLLVKSINLLLLPFILKEEVLAEIVAGSTHSCNDNVHNHMFQCNAAAMQILNVKADLKSI